jgi:hypothetical protein
MIMVLLVLIFVAAPLFKRNRISRPAATRNRISTLMDYEESHSISPEDLVFHLLENNAILFAGETGKYHETARFINTLVPLLPRSGVGAVGVFFLNHGDQERIDALMGGETFNEDLADELLFDNLIMNGYGEYRDFLKALWQENRGNEEDRPALRLIGLNPGQNWTVLQTAADGKDPRIIKKIYASGVPDSYMARIIEEEIIDRGLKGFVYTTTPSSLALIESDSYREKMAESGFPEDTHRTAWLVNQRPGVTCATLMIHAPWPVEGSRYGIDYPLGGVLDSLMEAYPKEKRRLGFLTGGTPFGELAAAPGSFGAGESRPLSDFCDGYVLLGPISEYTPFTVIPEFINGDNFAEAVRNFPGPKESMAATPDDMNEFIAGTAINIKQILEKFKK